MKYLITEKSRNKKVGPLMVVTATKATCWEGCPLMGRGCYAEQGPLGMLWAAMSAAPADAETFRSGRAQIALHTEDDLVRAIRARHIGEGWRYAQAGDLPGKGPAIDARALQRIADANKRAQARGWGYTHKPVLGNSKQARDNRAAIAAAVKSGFVINLSGNTLAHADELADLGIAPVACMLPEDQTEKTKTPSGRDVIPCPAETYHRPIDCRACMLCAVPDRRVIIGFPAHGTRKKLASAIASG